MCNKSMNSVSSWSVPDLSVPRCDVSAHCTCTVGLPLRRVLSLSLALENTSMTWSLSRHAPSSVNYWVSEWGPVKRKRLGECVCVCEVVVRELSVWVWLR